MQNPSVNPQIIFDDAKLIIEKMNRSNTVSELLKHQENLNKLQQYFSFFSVVQEFDHFKPTEEAALLENNLIDEETHQTVSDEIVADEKAVHEFEEELNLSEESKEILSSNRTTESPEEYILEDEAAFNNEFNQIEPVEILETAKLDLDKALENETEIHTEEDDLEFENGELQIAEEELEAVEELQMNIENEVTNDLGTVEVSEEKEEDHSRRKIIDILREPAAQDHTKVDLPLEEKISEERKFKLANIKGLKKIQELFEDDPLEEDETAKAHQAHPPVSSEVERNMEAKRLPEFRLDLNDRIAFTNSLFGGSQSDLNETVKILNSFTDSNEAKEYLSDLYYSRNWKKADDYAQRLWNLVENRFA